jgi:hypothetical protein
MVLSEHTTSPYVKLLFINLDSYQRYSIYNRSNYIYIIYYLQKFFKF